MKAVILAAGKGIRMHPLTMKIPKPLLKVNGKPILDYILESFPSEIDEIIIVINYLGNQIKKHVGKTNRSRRVRYVLGSDKGTAYSFLSAKKHLSNERFLLIYGDEIPNSQDIRKCLKKDLSILTFKSQNPGASGIAYLRQDTTIRKIIEKPDKTGSSLAIDGIMVLNTDIFDCTPKLSNGEFYFSTMVSDFAHNHKLFPVKLKKTIVNITTPDDLFRAENALKAGSNTGNQGNN